MHYTWPSQLLWAANGSEAWSFEKRRISGAEAVMLLPKVPLPPPFVPGAWITPSAAVRTLLNPCTARAGGVQPHGCTRRRRPFHPPPLSCHACRPPSPCCAVQAPKGRPTTQALYDTILLLIETINSGIDEVGGPKWRETLEGGGARPW